MGELDKLRWSVFLRDGGCIAAQGDKVGPENVAEDACANRYGYPCRYNDLLQMTLEHVRKYAAMGGPKVDAVEGMVTLCWHHGVQGWELRHKDVERAYLARLYPEWWADWLELRA